MKDARNELPPEHYNAANYLARRNKKLQEELNDHKRAIEEVERKLTQKIEYSDFDKEKKFHEVHGMINHVENKVEQVNIRVDKVQADVLNLGMFVAEKFGLLKGEMQLAVERSRDYINSIRTEVEAKLGGMELSFGKQMYMLEGALMDYQRKLDAVQHEYRNDIDGFSGKVEQAYQDFDYAKKMLETDMTKWLFEIFKKNEGVALELNQKKLEIEATADKAHLVLKDIEVSKKDMELYYEKRENALNEKKQELDMITQDQIHKEWMLQRQEKDVRTQEEIVKSRMESFFNEQKRKTMEKYIKDLEQENKYLADHQIPLMLDGGYNLVGDPSYYGYSDSDINRRVGELKRENPRGY